jgi:3-keto-disaccharide hydrolase
MSLLGVVIVATATVAVAAADAADEKAKTYTFAKAELGKVPTGWKAEQTGKGEGSVWKVAEDATAPSKSGFVLAQTAESPGPMFNLCVLGDSNLADVEVSVRFKAVEGVRDQGGGLVWRYQDANNYYVARMNPLEDNYRLYHVVAGKRTQFGGKEGIKVPAGEWHSLTVRMVGEKIECSLDGQKEIEGTDKTITKAGKVGLWTKSDARSRFDQFVVNDLAK